jgi:hypothetical protein
LNSSKSGPDFACPTFSQCKVRAGPRIETVDGELKARASSLDVKPDLRLANPT